MTPIKRTGKIRYRVECSLFGRQKCVLQTQWEGHVMINAGAMIDSEFRTWWRDATPQDLSELAGGLTIESIHS